MQDKNILSNATYMFPAFTMVQQITTELSDAATDQGNIAIITRLFMNNANIAIDF
jgi:hypothetical protein